ncbi:hypothetical protein C8R43DRAFT_924428 [Mycena crocata]|nr:hypothetical protein C8R43DRAFT_924428 [Mycena crocata]
MTATDSENGHGARTVGDWNISFNTQDPSDLLVLGRSLLRPRHPLISHKDCVAIFEVDATLFTELADLWNTKGDPGIFVEKASPIYEKLKAGYEPPPSKIILEPPPESNQTIHDRIAAFTAELRPVFESFINRASSVAEWAPTEDTPYFDWLKEQGFPDSGGKPDLLLHKLGSFRDDSKLRARLKKIFVPRPKAHMFVVNTSGSGKTKLMLEGLCLHWGFYFASLVDSTVLGSCDVENAIHQYVPDSAGFVAQLPDNNGQAEYMLSLERNRLIASKRFSEILLARIIIFELFTEVIKNRLDVAEPKKLWLLIQLHPLDLGFAGGDFFDRLSRALYNSDPAFVTQQIEERLETTRKWCFQDHNDNTSYFIVLDEAQHAARCHFSAFRSEQFEDIMGNPLHRPILREIVRAWVITKLGLWMIISGTGVDADVINKVLASAVMKPADHRRVYDIGAFTNYGEHAAFIEHYIPPSILEAESGKALLKRMMYWLHGRHRFTTAFLSELINQCFRSPHRLLNDFVKANTGITPTDGQRWVAAEPVTFWPDDVGQFDFGKLARHPILEEKIRELVNSNLIRDNLPTPVTIDEKDLVEWGFARYIELDRNKIVIDEPLVLTAALKVARSSVHFSNRIHVSSTTGKFNGFEDYLGFVFPHLFAEKPNLSQVFDFTESSFIPSWASFRAELVSIHDAGLEMEESVVLPNARPHFNYGSDTDSDTASTIRWLKHYKQTFLCFPGKRMGPDLLCVLRVLDNTPKGSLLWVAVQAKFSEASHELKSETLRSAIRSVTPTRFWIDKKDGVFEPEKSPYLVRDTLRALRKLPRRMADDAGTYSMLRVVAACPLRTGLTKKRAAGYKYYEDIGNHPLASLNMDFLAKITQDLQPTRKIFSMMNFGAVPIPDVNSEPEDEVVETVSDTEAQPDAEADDDVEMPAASTSKRPFPDNGDSDEGSRQARSNKKVKGKAKAKGKGKAKGKQATAGSGLSVSRRLAWDTSAAGDVSMASPSAYNSTAPSPIV